MSSSPWTTIGLDVGGTKVLGVAVSSDEPSVIRCRRLVPTPVQGAGLVEVLTALIGELTAEADTAVAAVGVGVPGLVDVSGALRVGPHLQAIRDLPLADELRAASGLPAAVDNDANCHAVAENRAGAAAGAGDALVVTLGTGVGAGIITGGVLQRGAHGFAGEPGHMIVEPHGVPCPCGQRGCWERYASGSGLGRMARAAAEAGRLDAVVELAGGDPDAVRGEHVTASARLGDQDAAALLDEMAWWIALGLANLTNLYDPSTIVIGGGLVEAADLLLPPVRTHFADLVMAPAARTDVRIVPALLGEDAGALGAAALAVDLVAS